MISDKNAEAIARSILSPFIDMGIVSDAALANAIEIVKLKCEQDEWEKVAERAEAGIAMHKMLTNAIKGLPDA